MKTCPQLAVKQLTCIRQNKSLFEPVSFTVEKGGALLIEGSNGAGKSSLLRLIAGIATPATGEVLWQNHAISDNLTYKEQLHYLGHSNGIKAGLTIAENLTLAATLSQQPLNGLELILAELSLEAYKNTQTVFLSAGQKRRVALARMMLIPRPLWILDEPFTSLDVRTQTILLAQIEAHLDHGGSCLITSHQAVHLPTRSLQRMELVPC